MPDQESAALANPPVAPQSEPQMVPSLYTGLRVLPMLLYDTYLAPGKNIATGLADEAKTLKENPEARVNFLTGLVGTGEPGEEGMAEAGSELSGEAKKLYEGLRVRKADAVSPAELAKQAGVIYKGELTKGSDVHMFEHPDHPGKTMAANARDLTTPDALKERVNAKVEQFRPAKNASGESAASQEAINRSASEKSAGIERLKIDTRSGKETPLHGVDAVDIKPSAHEIVIQRGPKGITLLDKGAKVNYIPEKYKQDLASSDTMENPDTRFTAARHEAGHAVVGELLRPGSVENMTLRDAGATTNVSAPAGKTEIPQLTRDEIKDMMAVSLAGGLSEPGGTTTRHSSSDRDNRARIIGALASTPAQNLERLATGKTKDDAMLRAPEIQAEANAKVRALLADPWTQRAIDGLAGKFNEKGSLSGSQVRKYLDSVK